MAIMLARLFSGFFYSSPPFKLGGQGIGELLDSTGKPGNAHRIK